MAETITIISSQEPVQAPTRLRMAGSDFLAGSLSTLLTLSYSVSYGMLIFSSHELRPYEADGIRAALMAAWCVALVVALGSSLHFSIAGPDSNATAILTVMAASVAHTLAVKGVPREEIVLGVLTLLAGSAILAGLFVLGLGLARGGRIVRFIPYPVAGGFLAGTGFLIVAGATKVLTGRSLSIELFRSPPDVNVVAWATVALVTLALLVLPRVIKHYLTVPLTILAGVGLFFAMLGYAGIDIEAAREQGLIFNSIESTAPRNPIFRSPSEIPWETLFSQWQNFSAMTLVVIVTVLLNCTGLELATRSDVQFDRELVANGAANILSGLLGGMIGYTSLSRSLLNFKAGAGTRAAGMIAAVLCAGAAFLWTPALSYLPKPVLAGLLFFLGLSLLREWVWDSYFKLPWQEYALATTILLLIVTNGLLVGVAFGLLVSLVLFVYNYSRASCVRHDFSAGTHFSNKERNVEQNAILKRNGHQARALCLQGFLFFGSASSIVELAKQHIQDSGVRHLLLDFRMVQGLDASAVLGFNKLDQIARKSGVKLYFCGLRSELGNVFIQTKFLPNDNIAVLPDLDRGLERVEEVLIDEGRRDPEAIAAAVEALEENARKEESVTMHRMFGGQLDAEAIMRLITCCDTKELSAGERLFRKGDTGDALYFIEKGQISILLMLEGKQMKRLRTFGPGTIIGEMAVFAHGTRSADALADEPTRVRCLTSEAIEKMMREAPKAALQFHAYVIRLMATRLAQSNDEVQTLL